MLLLPIIGMAYVAVAYICMAYVSIAYVGMVYVAIAYIGMACIAIAYIGMAYVAIARYGLYSHGTLATVGPTRERKSFPITGITHTHISKFASLLANMEVRHVFKLRRYSGKLLWPTIVRGRPQTACEPCIKMARLITNMP